MCACHPYSLAIDTKVVSVSGCRLCSCMQTICTLFDEYQVLHDSRKSLYLFPDLSPRVLIVAIVIVITITEAQGPGQGIYQKDRPPLSAQRDNVSDAGGLAICYQHTGWREEVGECESDIGNLISSRLNNSSFYVLDNLHSKSDIYLVYSILLSVHF